MCTFCPHLCVDAEAAVECVPRAGNEAQSEFALEHEHAGAWGGGEGEELED